MEEFSCQDQDLVCLRWPAIVVRGKVYRQNKRLFDWYLYTAGSSDCT